MGALYFEKHGEEEFDGHAMTIAPALVSPQARGRVWLRSADPFAKPRILTNSLAEPDDVASMVAAMRMGREIAAASPVGDVVVRELKPGAEAQEPDELEAALRERLELIYHPAGTCRMSDTGDDAVVDSDLRVHGIDSLRVIDASIFPLIPGGNTHAPTVMVAERGADLIRGRVAAAAG
jgi:choline dehydrogenase-like flavoprotein